MIDEEFFLSLPDDPDDAFLAFEARIGKEFDTREESFISDSRLHYIEYIVAYCLETNYKLGIDPKKIFTSSPILVDDAFRTVKNAISKKRKSLELRRLVRLRSGASSEYALDPALKMQIHHYLSQIRQIIAAAPLSQQKRDALSNRLNAFAAEVDRDRTRLDALTSMYLFLKRETVDELEPVLEKIEKILEAIAKAGEWIEILGPKKQKELPSPPKQIEGPVSLSDDA